MQFMTCSTCARVVQINNTGICLGCQRGFTGLDAEDVYKPQDVQVKVMDDISQTNAIDAEIKRLQDRQKEIEDALKEVSEQKGNIAEHQDGNGGWEAPKASGGNSFKRRKKG